MAEHSAAGAVHPLPFAHSAVDTDPVLAFQSVASGVARHVEAASAVVDALPADWDWTRDGSSAALSAFRQQIAGVRGSRIAVPSISTSRTPPSTMTFSAPLPSDAFPLTFPNIDRAFALLARRLHRTFPHDERTLQRHYAQTSTATTTTATAVAHTAPSDPRSPTTGLLCNSALPLPATALDSPVLAQQQPHAEKSWETPGSSLAAVARWEREREREREELAKRRDARQQVGRKERRSRETCNRLEVRDATRKRQPLTLLVPCCCVVLCGVVRRCSCSQRCGHGATLSRRGQ